MGLCGFQLRRMQIKEEIDAKVKAEAEEAKEKLKPEVKKKVSKIKDTKK
jgi:hypothetical protein